MTFGFNAFVAPTIGLDINGNDALIFPVSGQPGVEFRVRITPAGSATTR